jgi:hypothetical protein
MSPEVGLALFVPSERKRRQSTCPHPDEGKSHADARAARRGRRGRRAATPGGVFPYTAAQREMWQLLGTWDRSLPTASALCAA